MKWTALILATTLAMAGMATAQSLDFEVYRTKVEPIFSKKREGHSRCVSCHTGNHSVFVLQPFSEGTTKYSVEQSRKNFEGVKKMVVAGNPDKSKLLLHPLAQEGGGDEFHSGGRQFLTKSDPDWKIMADWVRGAKSSK